MCAHSLFPSTCPSRTGECNIPRYKVVVQVTLGQMKDQGVRVASRCLWDTSTDNYASTRYQNQSLWCCAMIFGLYCE